MERKENAKPLNEIRIGFRSRVRNIVNYANILLKENNYRSLNLSAIGGAIGSLVNAVEVLRITNPGLYQNNKIGTVSYQTVDQQGNVQNQRLYPKLEVVLSLDAPKDQGEGFQDKLSEEERTQLFNLSKENQQGGEERGERGRGRGFGGRGAPRGGRGFGGRGRGRGGPRGGRGFGGRGRGFGGNRDFGGDRNFGGDRDFEEEGDFGGDRNFGGDRDFGSRRGRGRNFGGDSGFRGGRGRNFGGEGSFRARGRGGPSRGRVNRGRGF